MTLTTIEDTMKIVNFGEDDTDEGTSANEEEDKEIDNLGLEDDDVLEDDKETEDEPADEDETEEE